MKAQPVDPRDTSRRCPECNPVSEKNRIRRDVFLCDECGYFEHADIVGAKNIRSGALTHRARSLRSGGNSRKSSSLAPSTIAERKLSDLDGVGAFYTLPAYVNYFC